MSHQKGLGDSSSGLRNSNSIRCVALGRRTVAPGSSSPGGAAICTMRQLHPLDQLVDDHLIGGGVDRLLLLPSAVVAPAQFDGAALAPETERVKLEIFWHKP
ncbi:MAG: hypothetical protein CM1200mP29_08690 [Verrucomicrobiota bacterium]|nr:MAG: hypothetical protein CM1200mP29_08690 [Verrucomicrobiota bacterium]